jgi:hypothetical protein
MTYSPNFPSRHLTQIVRVVIARDPAGLLVARSADLPGRAAFATDIASLDQAIRDVIERYFADRDERVHVRRSPGRPLNDLSTWEVDTIDGDEQLWAAE